MKNDTTLLNALVDAADTEVRKASRSRDFHRHRKGPLDANHMGHPVPSFRQAFEKVLATNSEWIPYSKIFNGEVRVLKMPEINQLVEVCTRHRDRRLATLETLSLAVPGDGRIGNIWIGDDNYRLYARNDQEGHDAVVTHWRPLSPLPDPSERTA